MKTKTIQIVFTRLPKDYEGLCRRVLIPRKIRDEAEHAVVSEIVNTMALHNDEFTADQEDYFDLLCSLLEKWDAEHEKFPRRSPLQRLQFLMERNNLNGAALSGILGVSRNLGPMILRGERDITVAHARALGAHFGLRAGAFIE